MGATRVGITGDWPAFGVKSTAVSWGYLQRLDFEDQSEKTELPDEDDDVVGSAYHHARVQASFEVIVKATAGAPGASGRFPGTWLTINHPARGNLQVIGDTCNWQQVNTDWVKLSGQATQYPFITTTTTTTTTT